MKALYNISYGLFVLTAKDEKYNGCIINTLMQITSNPVQVSITINKENYTTKMIEKTGKFNVSIIDKSAKFDLIERFGFASGKNVNKFDGFTGYKISKNGLPYITEHVNSYLSCKVVSKIDVGTHFTFIAEVECDEVISDSEPMTYAYYINNVKPKQGSVSGDVYVCRICGYVHKNGKPDNSFICPICKHGADVFEKQTTKEEKTEEKYYCPLCGYSVSAEKSDGTCVLCGAKMTKEKPE